MKNAIFAVFLTALTTFVAGAQNSQNINVSGTWGIEYHDKNGVEVNTPMVTLLQSGGQLDGVFGSQHWKVRGTLAGNSVTFSFSPPGHPEVVVKYQGTLESANQIRGTMASQVQSGTFVATRK